VAFRECISQNDCVFLPVYFYLSASHADKLVSFLVASVCWCVCLCKTCKTTNEILMQLGSDV